MGLREILNNTNNDITKKEILKRFINIDKIKNNYDICGMLEVPLISIYKELIKEIGKPMVKQLIFIFESIYTENNLNVDHNACFSNAIKDIEAEVVVIGEVFT